MYTKSSNNYTVTFYNQSNTLWHFCLFQQLRQQPEDYFSLVWQAFSIYPGGNASFSWTENYLFTLSNDVLLSLEGNTAFASNNSINADVSLSNQTTLSYAQGSLLFSTPISNKKSGSLFIDQDNSIQSNAGAVGIRVFNNASIAVNANSNVNTEFDTGNLSYWCVCGDNFNPGQVLDVCNLTAQIAPKNNASIQTTNAVELAFTNSNTNLFVTLSSNNILSVSSQNG